LGKDVRTAAPRHRGAELDRGAGIDEDDEAAERPGSEHPGFARKRAGDDSGGAHDSLADDSADHDRKPEPDSEDPQQLTRGAFMLRGHIPPAPARRTTGAA